MTYIIQSWREEEILPLFTAVDKAMTIAERYNDGVMSFYLKVLLNLIMARFEPIEEERQLK